MLENMKPRRYRLLLDENFFTREYLPILNSRHNVKHLVQDVKLGGISDPKVYNYAVKQKRLIATFNREDFEEMANISKETGIISVSTNLSDEQIDKKITSLLSKSTPGQLFGKFHHITSEPIRHESFLNDSDE